MIDFKIWQFFFSTRISVISFACLAHTFLSFTVWRLFFVRKISFSETSLAKYTCERWLRKNIFADKWNKIRWISLNYDPFFRERTWTIFILHFHFYVDRKRIPTPLKISWGWLKILFVIQETYCSDKLTKRSRKKRTIFIGCNLPQFTDNLFNIKDISVIFIDNNDRGVKKHLRAV